jgi:hypothetical protein
MTTLRNVSPLGDLYVNGHGVIPAGGEFTVADGEADTLIHQAENFELTTTPVTVPDVVDTSDVINETPDNTE